MNVEEIWEDQAILHWTLFVTLSCFKKDWFIYLLFHSFILKPQQWWRRGGRTSEHLPLAHPPNVPIPGAVQTEAGAPCQLPRREAGTECISHHSLLPHVLMHLPTENWIGSRVASNTTPWHTSQLIRPFIISGTVACETVKETEIPITGLHSETSKGQDINRNREHDPYLPLSSWDPIYLSHLLLPPGYTRPARQAREWSRDSNPGTPVWAAVQPSQTTASTSRLLLGKMEALWGKRSLMSMNLVMSCLSRYFPFSMCFLKYKCWSFKWY